MKFLQILVVIIVAIGLTILALPIFALIAHMIVGLTRMVWGI